MCATVSLEDSTDLNWLRDKRDHQPVWKDEESGLWHIVRYADVAAALSNYHTFSSDFMQTNPNDAELIEGNIVAMDPPRHDQLRGLVSLAFTPRRIAQLEGRISGIADGLIDKMDSDGHVELVADLAYPLPVTVIAELLGVPAEDRARFKVWADALLDQQRAGRDSASALEAARAEIRHFHDYLREHVMDRLQRPRADLLSDLVAAEIDGQRLENEEIVGFATLLLLAGHITTTLLLGNAVLCLDELPGVQRALRANPELVPVALEEVLRYRSPIPQTARVTTTELQLADQTVPAKQMLMVSLLSANHDERQFPDAETFVIDRHPNPHLAFGKGIHFCLGAPLARLEARIALNLLLQRFSDIRVDPTLPSEHYVRFNGQRTLHVVVER
jgi:cytochrome P450